MIDAHERTFGFAFDAAGRLVAETTPLGHTARHEYDAKGNRIALILAGRPAHRFGYTTHSLTDTWDPPAVEGVTARLEAQYNPEVEQVRLRLPDGTAIEQRRNRTETRLR